MRTVERIIVSLFLLGGIVAVVGACSKKDSGQMMVIATASSTAMNYDHIHMDLAGVQFHYLDESLGEKGWVTLETHAANIDLLQLQNDFQVMLAKGERLQQGNISEIRLVPGTRSTLVLNGISYALKIPAALQSGIRVRLDAAILPHECTSVLLRLDIDRSLLWEEGGYALRPVFTSMIITNADIR